MVAVLGTNIISPLGYTTQENYDAVRHDRSALTSLEGWKGVPEKITASVFDKFHGRDSGHCGFEELVIDSIASALKETPIDPASPRTVLILSTTKGDIENLSTDTASEYNGPAGAALRIARHFCVTTEPVVVCNACISGGNAQLMAARLIECGTYDNAIVCGADTVSAFTVSGFLSFKALSPFECRPFDIERLGLNLGEAAATMIFGRVSDNVSGRWVIEAGALTNDAYHCSAPSPDGDGLCRAISSVTDGVPSESIDCISLHGTATMFNDQMESRAIQKAGLSDVPATSLKGFYGHTLGAAGLLETILTMRALEERIVLPTRGFGESGVSGKISVSAEGRTSGGNECFIKILSGFGGCNCALRYSRANNAVPMGIEPGSIKVIGGVHLESPDNLEEIYRNRLENYPKFHKMDMLSKLSYAASELLLNQYPEFKPSSVILFNGTSSTVQDLIHIGTITGTGGFYPSPSVFLYTLPNLAAGEIAIRNGIKGETALYILQRKDASLMDSILKASLPKGTLALTGWVDCPSADDFVADLKLMTIT